MKTIKPGDCKINPDFIAQAKKAIHSSTTLAQLCVKSSSLIGMPSTLKAQYKGDSLAFSIDPESSVTEINFVLHSGVRKEWRFHNRNVPRRFAPALFAFYGTALQGVPYVLRSSDPALPDVIVATYSHRVCIPLDDDDVMYDTVEGITVRQLEDPDAELESILYALCEFKQPAAMSIEKPTRRLSSALSLRLSERRANKQIEKQEHVESEDREEMPVKRPRSAHERQHVQ